MPYPDPRIELHTVYTSPAGRAMEFISYWERTGGFGFTDVVYITNFTDEFSGFIAPELTGLLVPGSQYVGTKGKLSHAGLVFTAISTNGAGPGMGGGDTIPDHVAVVIQKHTTHPGRSGRGRWFIGAIPAAFVNDNELTGAGVIAYAALALKLTSQFTETASGDIWNPDHQSRLDNAWYNITGYTVQPFLKRHDKRLFRSLLSG